MRQTDGWRCSWQTPRVEMGKAGQNARRPHFLGCGLLENVADLSCSALSSDTARTIIVTGVTTAGGAELGPGEDHDAAIQPNGVRCQARLEAGDAAVQVVFVRSFDPGGDDLADFQRAPA